MCSKDLLLFLKERIPRTIDEMCALADQYKGARNANILSPVHSGRKDFNLEPKGGASKSQQTQNDQKKPKDTQPTGKEIRYQSVWRLDILQTSVGIETQLQLPLVKTPDQK